MKRTFVRPEAQSDIREAASWYEDRERGLGPRFLREVRESLGRTRANPRMYPVIEEDARRALVHKFPDSIYFVNEEDAIAVIAVLHQNRRPALWKSRMT